MKLFQWKKKIKYFSKFHWNFNDYKLDMILFLIHYLIHSFHKGLKGLINCCKDNEREILRFRKKTSIHNSLLCFLSHLDLPFHFTYSQILEMYRQTWISAQKKEEIYQTAIVMYIFLKFHRITICNYIWNNWE